MGLLIGVITGFVVGFVLAAIYNTGYMSMPTWVPLAWAFIQVSVTIMSSFSEISLNVL